MIHLLIHKIFIPTLVIFIQILILTWMIYTLRTLIHNILIILIQLVLIDRLVLFIHILMIGFMIFGDIKG
jgi:hypothetical protein